MPSYQAAAKARSRAKQERTRQERMAAWDGQGRQGRHPVVVEVLTPTASHPGTPTTFTDAMARRILSEMWKGRTLGDVLDDPGMPSRNTVLVWTEAIPEFRLAYFRARLHGVDALADQAIAIADDMSRDVLNGEPNPVAVARDKIRIETRFKYAAKLNPRQWGERVIAEEEQQGKQPLISAPPHETREQWIERRRKERAAGG